MADAVFDQVSVEIDAHASTRSRRRTCCAPPRATCASRASARSTSKGRDTEAEDEDAEKSLPDLTAGDRSAPARSVTAGPALHRAAAALHRGDAREGARGERHRPAVHLRADHVDDPGPRLREEGRPRAQARGAGLRRQRHADGALPRRRRCRLHGAHGGRAGRRRERRAAVAAGRARVLRPARRRRSRPRPTRRASSRRPTRSATSAASR